MTKYMTRQEVADYFKVSLWTIINWQNKGFLNPVRIGRSIVFLKSEVKKKQREDLYNKRVYK